MPYKEKFVLFFAAIFPYVLRPSETINYTQQNGKRGQWEEKRKKEKKYKKHIKGEIRWALNKY